MNPENERTRPGTSFVGIFIIGCISLVILIISVGAAYTSVKSARLSAAKASIGHIETVLKLAEMQAERDGFGPPPDTYQSLIKSYDDGAENALSAYEKYILAAMLEQFGPFRDFDFAVTRYQDATGIHTQVYFFPYAGQTDVKRDRYYLMQNDAVFEHNTL